MRKGWLAIAICALLVFALALSGCGQANNEEGKESEGANLPATTEKKEETPKKDPVKLKMAVFGFERKINLRKNSPSTARCLRFRPFRSRK